MVDPMKFLDEDDFGAPKNKIYERNLIDLIANYQPVEKTDEDRISIRFAPNCYDTACLRLEKRVKSASQRSITQKAITSCVITWGRSKFQSVADYRDLIRTRSNKALHCDSEEEKMMYMSSTSAHVIKPVNKEYCTKDVRMTVDKKDFEYMSRIASVMKMDLTEVAIYFFAIGIARGVDESNLSESQKTPDWELKNWNEIISKVDRHLRTMHIDIERFEKIQSLKGTCLV